MQPSQEAIDRVVTAALAEDVGGGDLTSAAVIPATARFSGRMATRQAMVVAGLDIAREVFRRLTADLDWRPRVSDGERLSPGAVLVEVAGPARALLTGERTALNLVQHLSGIATLTSQYVAAIAGTGAVLLDTRKTVPGLRELAKYAVRQGGGRNHRLRLDDGVLVKDNHLAVCGSVAEAVRRARAAGLVDLEVECATLEQVREALTLGVPRLLLDNMDLPTLRAAVELARGLATTEASGTVDLATIRRVAETGVDFISVGRITHSAPAIDIGLDWTVATAPPGR